MGMHTRALGSVGKKGADGCSPNSQDPQDRLAKQEQVREKVGRELGALALASIRPLTSWPGKNGKTLGIGKEGNLYHACRKEPAMQNT